MDKKIVSYVIFDFDGTLVDTESVHVKTWQDVSRHFDILHGYDFTKTVGLTDKTFTEILRKEHADLPHDILSKKEEFFLKVDSSAFKAYEGVIDTLEKLKTIGVKIAIASNGTHDYIKRISSYAGVDKYIDYFSGFERELGMKEKPSTDVYINALNALKADLNKTIAVEDSPVGITSSKAAGIYTFGVLNTYKEDRIASSDIVIKNMLDIFQYCDFVKP